ncbi:MAG: penicillin-binding protein 2 [Silicimonas sp.]|nr:penicillin-binding protein 2 [Silicimonas sp.]NND19145.1 penicillin-binding protein 2 [Silicimonas sp.]NND21255.1 penicillin-binding protein 2 [Silicimonas sp.]NNF92065.1 penicillin-binding protein 2 [Boseongicola sp.]NNL72604.1 penicillin-binding protein 2 [Silicimonas sp.]
MRRSPKEVEESVGLLTRRGLVLGGVQLGFMGVLGLRMRQMQVEEAEQYRLLAEENRINMRLIAPSRGIIYDRHGIPVAENVQNYRIVIVREDAGDVEATIEKLRRIMPLDETELDRALKEMYRRSPFVPVTLADRLTWEDLAEVAINAPVLPGITPEVGLSRAYPLREDFAHIVGYVGPVSDYDLSNIEDPNPLLQIPRFQIGKIGVETKLEADLRGKAGSKRIEINAAGRVMRELSRDEYTPGEDIQLTIDHGLQNYAQSRLANESAGSVVIDVETGDLLAMASAPSFDPNLFVRGISSSDYSELRDNIYKPLFNKAVQGLYPPGSTFKMMTGLAALRAGVIGPGERVYCPGYMAFGGRRFHCWKRGGHGWMDLNDAITQSCDVYFYESANRVGVDRLADLCSEFGLGHRHDIPVSAVREGIVPSTQWKAQVRGERWNPGETLNTAIGQGDVLTSPLQLAVMTARIASGRATEPRLVKSVNGVEAPIKQADPLNIPSNLMTLVRRAMYNVSNGQRGTARRSRIVAEGLEMAGKTGTSQVRNITAAERARGVVRNDQLPWNRRDHGLFVAFAPFDKPKYAIATVVEHGGGGSSAAAPPSRDILLYALYGDIPPLEAYPSDQRERIRVQHEEMVLRPRLEPEKKATRA